jgi:hypothetical protein
MVSSSPEPRFRMSPLHPNFHRFHHSNLLSHLLIISERHDDIPLHLIPDRMKTDRQCISINHNFFSSPTLPTIFSGLITSQERVENSIQDVKEMIISRLGPNEWRQEWVGEVQGLLERDAGWGWRGFWDCVGKNLDVRSPSSFLSFHLPNILLPIFIWPVNSRPLSVRRVDHGSL